MIFIGEHIIETKHFPDGTPLIKLDPMDIQGDFASNGGMTIINWFYESMDELFTLQCLVGHLRDNCFEPICLYMPYLPNARQDRVKNEEDVFTLKYFCQFINSLNFKWVHILDAHSSVGPALIDRVINESPRSILLNVFTKLDYNEKVDMDNLIIFYPDEGAMKRYSELIESPYAFGVKRRNWEEGKIDSLEVITSESLEGKDILIIDDICSFGGTFYRSAKKLKELGANKIYLYITHCEDNILKGELFKSDLIEKVYTTNSILNEFHEKIEVIEL
jgi:ribose-phosphate pyrophosphokinase